MIPEKIIAIGASAGGIECCKKLLASLRPDFAGAVVIVLHINADSPGMLPQVFSRSCALPVVSPNDNDPIVAGTVYVAPPDHHMLVKLGRIRLVYGPKENHSRPAIDPLFRSAAAAYGPKVTGVILSGNLDDGTAGLAVIKGKGGVAIVQDPKEAEYPGMPESAVENVEVDHILPADRIGEFLAASSPRKAAANLGETTGEDILELSLDDLQTIMEGRKAVGLTCPLCGGVLREKTPGDTADFRCRVGHAFSIKHLEDSLVDATEGALWNAVRVLEEKERLCDRLARMMIDSKNAYSASRFEEKGKRASRDARIIREIVLNQEHKSNASEA